MLALAILALALAGFALAFVLERHPMPDFSKLTAAIQSLATAVQALVAANANVQPQIDSATASVEAITSSLPQPPA